MAGSLVQIPWKEFDCQILKYFSDHKVILWTDFEAGKLKTLCKLLNLLNSHDSLVLQIHFGLD